MTPIVTLRLREEQDVVVARQRARQIAAIVGFETQDQIRVATAVSEIARNGQMYGHAARVEFSIDGSKERQSLLIRVSDTGPGIADLQSILRGTYESKTGMGIGIAGARRLMDAFEIQSSASGTVVTLRKLLPRRARKLRPPDITALADKLAKDRPTDAWDEVQSQNRELLTALGELSARQEELRQLNRELEDTNRGVVALYADLDEKAEHLRQANQLKSTFLSHMSHEFRTPLNSIMALSRILMDRMDGPLTSEQEKQVEFIFRAAQELTEMVNDLLDLAKVEAGKIDLHPTEWTVETLFGVLRGMMRPLLAGSPVQLIFDDTADIPPLFTDETKVSQILRNFVSNAIKFTERGEIRVAAGYNEHNGLVSLSVTDTGMGIDPADHARIFEHYVQVDSAKQRRVKGTGLGLSLSKNFAEILGGTITLHSVPGEGSTFTLTIPVRLPVSAGQSGKVSPTPAHASTANPVILVIDDEETARYVVRKQLAGLNISVLEAQSGVEGVTIAQKVQPDLILLDLNMPGMTGYEVSEQLKADPRTSRIPVLIHTSRRVSRQERERLGCRGVIGKDEAGKGVLKIHVMEILQPQSKDI